jgi:hypothetical protein
MLAFVLLRYVTESLFTPIDIALPISPRHIISLTDLPLYRFRALFYTISRFIFDDLCDVQYGVTFAYRTLMAMPPLFTILPPPNAHYYHVNSLRHSIAASLQRPTPPRRRQNFAAHCYLATTGLFYIAHYHILFLVLR